MIPAPERARRWLPALRPCSARFSAQLDLLRWVAAFLVCITHVRSLVLQDFPADANPGWALRAFYFLHGFGHEAVMIFFIMSGYLVGGEILRHWQRERFEWADYVWRRATRLYPVYLAALAVGGTLDHLGLRLFPETGLYTQAFDSPMIFYNVAARLGWTTLWGNVAFCQEILVPCFGSNVPLWSLTNEAWYYLLFPLAGGLLFLDHTVRVRWVCLVLLAAALWFVRGPVLLYSTIWMLGIVPYFLRRPIFRRDLPLLAGVFACMMAVRLRLFPALPVYGWHLVIGVVLVLLLNTMEHAAGPVSRWAGWHRALAGFSYSLYLLHWPLAIFLCGLAAHSFGYGLRADLGFASGLFYLALLAVIYALSWVMAFFTERRTAVLRAWRAAAMTRRPVATP